MTVDMNHLPPCGCVHECQSVSFTICRDGRGRAPSARIALARQALGLNESCLVSRRNVFIAAAHSAELRDWRAMEADGLAVFHSVFNSTGALVFRLTRAGAEAALLPGERLDPEDWP